MDRSPIDANKLFVGEDVFRLVVVPGELVMRPISDAASCVRRHLDVYSHRFEGEQPPGCWLVLSIRSYSEFCGMVTNAILLCLPVEVLEGGVVVLVCLDV